LHQLIPRPRLRYQPVIRHRHRSAFDF
jgi:hypothetical protein